MNPWILWDCHLKRYLRRLQGRCGVVPCMTPSEREGAKMPNGDKAEPLVSVILPMHNASRYVDAALGGVAAFEHSDIECLVVDDHSVDDTLDKVAAWCARIPRLRVLSSRARGVAAARNQALAEARGTFLWFADCDDLWSADLLESLTGVALDQRADVVVCNARRVFSFSHRPQVINDAPNDETITGREALVRLLNGDIQGHLWNKLFRRSIVPEEPFPITSAHSDLGGLIRILRAAEAVALQPASLYDYLIHAGSILNQRTYDWDALPKCLEIAEGAIPEAPTLEERNALLRFKYERVVIPVEHEAVRRAMWETEAVISAVRTLNRSRIDTSELAGLARQGQGGLVLRLLAIRYAAPVYRSLYMRHRRRAWSELDSL